MIPKIIQQIMSVKTINYLKCNNKKIDKVNNDMIFYPLTDIKYFAFDKILTHFIINNCKIGDPTKRRQL